MFAYILIALELSTLIFAVWYYFLRDHKQYKVSKPIWGVYENAQPQIRERKLVDDIPVLIFSQTSNIVILKTPNDPHKPSGPTSPQGTPKPSRHLGRAA